MAKRGFWWKALLGAAAFGGTVYGVKRMLHQEEIGGDADPEDSQPAANGVGPDGPQPLRYPVPSGKVTSPYGQRIDPVTGAPSENHNGVDFRAAEGTPLKAPGDGTVTRAWNDDLNGNALKIKVGDKTLGFAHLQKYATDTPPSKGDTFSAGAVLAYTGGGGPHEGKSTGPHLHMTMRDASGTLIDPMSETWQPQV